MEITQLIQIQDTIRISLAMLFLASGIWLFVYSAQMLSFSSHTFPWYSEWAWWEPIRLIFSTLAPVVFLGYRVASSSGTVGMVICNWGGASFYVMTGFTLFVDVKSGLILSTISCIGNALILLFQAVSILMKAHVNAKDNAALIIMTTAFVGYSLIAFLLYKWSRESELILTWRSIIKTLNHKLTRRN